ncbi:peptide chain release factor N(5)-glutamine methyltransferase [Bifidobacterium pullorum]|uniref:peptide chain release factor N(5)-glutamine methyltransferase n=1 Tax=Bifidobacterium pullorum TaxID=78448 RepID=UPI00307C89E5
MNVEQAIRRAAATLRDAGVDTPEHDAKLLLAEAYNCTLSDVDKAMLLGNPLAALAEGDFADDVPIAASDEGTPERHFDAMVARRAAREPLQYIVGHAPFRYLDLQVGPGVFIPRPETELVVQEGLDWLATQRIAAPRVVDLCTGSGAIGLSIVTETADAEVWAVELSERTAAWTRRNAEAVAAAAGTAHRYHLVPGDATASGTLAELDGTVDLVVTNPPYVPESEIPEQPEVRDYDPELALYGGSPDGLLIPERIIDRAAALLRPGGLLVMEHDISQGAALVAYAQAHGFNRARTGQDWTARPRYLVAVRI